MKPRPVEVSVLIPTRNRWSLLSTAALPSALEQTDVPLEVVIVDDGSTDDSADRVAELDDSRVRLIRHEGRRGVAAARNTAIGAARGTWLAFLDDDDLWSPRKLRTQLEAARGSNASFVFGGVVVLDEGRQIKHMTRASLDTNTSLESQLLTRNVIPAGSSNVLVATDLVRETGGFDERLTYTEDWDLWLRVAGTARAVSIPDFLVAYVRHPLATQFAGKRALRELRYFTAKHQARGLQADPARFLGWIALQHRLAGKRYKAASTYLVAGLESRRPAYLAHAAASLVDGDGKGLLRSFRDAPAASTEVEPEPDWLDRFR